MAVVGIGVVLIGFLAFKLTQDRIGVAVLQILGIGGIVGAGHNDHLVVSLVGLGVGAIAVNGLQVAVGVVVAIALGVDIHIIVQLLHGGLLFVSQLVTGGHGSIVQGVSILSAFNGGVNEMVSPVHTGAIGLATQGSGNVQFHILQITAIAVDVLVDGVNIEIVQLHGGDLVLADYQSGAHTAGNAHNGTLQGQTGYQGYAQG